MSESKISSGGRDVIARLKWALLLRLLAITLLLGATVALQAKASVSMLTVSLVSLYILVASTYVFTLLSLLVLRWVKRPRMFVYGQILYEVILVTALISVTGRIFSFAYMLSILSASILMRRRGAFVASTLSTLAYGGLVIVVNRLGERIFFVSGEFLVDIWGLGLSELVYAVAVNMAAFYMVAYLSSYLTEQLEQTGRQLREREEDIEELEARSENIIRSITSGIVTLDRDGRITSMNIAAEEITGAKDREIGGRRISTIFPGLNILDCPVEWMYNSRDGRIIHLAMSCSVLRGSRGQEIGRLLSFTDQTKLKEVQQQLKISDSLAAVGQLAAGLAHEVRNPLASISGSLQLLLGGGYEGDRDRLMRIVLREADRLNKLITEFLMFARPNIGPAQKIDLRDGLGEIMELFRQAHRPEDLKVELNCAAGMIVEIDPSLLKQIMWNLLINAAEAMEGKGAIDIQVDGSSGMTKITVSDTGPGIPPDVREKMFTPFFTTKEYGTGLGLATVYRTLEFMGGRVSVKSDPGKGAVIIIELPSAPKSDEKSGTMEKTK